VILGLLGVLPGMPHIRDPARRRRRRLRGVEAAQDAKAPAARTRRAEPVDLSKIGWDEVSDNMQVMLDIGYGLVPLVDERRGGR
jgi:flagellar biosynthesis protein FlhA